MTSFQQSLHTWYHIHRRELPWRDKPTPYHTWLSEIILQQTRVDQGTAYYHRFIAAFPTVHDLAEAHEDEVLKLWQGLGYYNRARNLHQAARQICTQFAGQFPANYDELLSLKGVGRYTAAAIASIAFNLPHAVVDGNVMRVLTRLHGIAEPIDKGSTQRALQSMADALLNRRFPGDHNQAMMELGATVCTPKQPLCAACPFQRKCVAFGTDTVMQLPVKEKKIKRKRRYFHYFILHHQGKTALKQRSTGDIWAGLFEFPMTETTTNAPLEPRQVQALLPMDDISIRCIREHPKHVLSHQDLFTRFYHIDIKQWNESPFNPIPIDDLHTFALPRLIDRYLENYDPVDGKKRS
jgi:A/G-specific adenine glycosylase